jgi:hydroxymethylbilane synthase
VNTIRIISRKSPLALWQADAVAGALRQAHPTLTVEIIGITTEGDRLLDRRLADYGGKGLFIKELEHRLLDGSADIAVHSMKDVTTTLPPGLSIPVILAREDPRDALVAPGYTEINALPTGARIGTSSLRRQCQLSASRGDLRIESVRGNVGTRLSKLDAGDYDALVLASAGLQRLGLAQRITTVLEVDAMLPAVGQGAIGVQCREDDGPVLDVIGVLDDLTTHLAVRAERAFTEMLDGGCHAPIGGYAVVHEQTIQLTGLVGRTDGSEILRDDVEGEITSPEQLGRALAEKLLHRGAGKILASLESPKDGER